MTVQHSHDLDGSLHDACPMCDEIRSRLPGAARDRGAETALEAYRVKAERLRTARERARMPPPPK